MKVIEKVKKGNNLKAFMANRVFQLRGEGAFEVLAQVTELERQSRKIIHLEIGQPDFDTPHNVKQVAIQAIQEGHTYYVPSAGIIDLRKAVCEYMKRTRNIEVVPEEVVIMPGAKPVIFLSFLMLLEEEDEVIYPDPGFPAYRSIIDFVGAKAVPLKLREEDGFRANPDEIKKLITSRTKMIVLNSPHNPTGSMLTEEEMEAIAKIAQEEDLLVFTDEVYSEIVYDRRHVSILEFPGMRERTVLLDAFSKSFAMTGWRLGYAILPKEWAEYLTLLATNSYSCTCTFTQMAGVEALLRADKAVKNMVSEFKRRRDFLVERLQSIKGLSFVKPEGAFYFFPNIRNFGLSSREMSQYLLEEAGVALLPGTCFGDFGEGYLRISYSNSLKNIAEAMDRIDKALQKLRV
ncbi:MAG: pyridoxal phosphate-dependent aminotransferase [Candidatus Atribacteria bacterium]|nr:pyridoxal phosphate-dependent aminotransferase [Candidatus Atribacteria bacterium]MCD6349733.1 pyridoxal phosphate-dependent aminotransferase [Candidatus Atribacteria bacterium]